MSNGSELLAWRLFFWSAIAHAGIGVILFSLNSPMRCCAISFCLFHGIYFTNRCLYCSLFFRNLFIRTNALTFFALNTTKLHVAFLYNIRHLHIWCGYSFAIVFTDFLIRFFQNYIAHFNEGVQGFTHFFGSYTFSCQPHLFSSFLDFLEAVFWVA